MSSIRKSTKTPVQRLKRLMKQALSSLRHIGAFVAGAAVGHGVLYLSGHEGSIVIVAVCGVLGMAVEMLFVLHERARQNWADARTQADTQIGELSQTNEALGGSIAALERGTGRLNEILDEHERVLRETNQMKMLASPSPFTGVLGSLYERTGGPGKKALVTRAEYLNLLREAVRNLRTESPYHTQMSSYLTIHPDGLRWFEGEAQRFLDRFGYVTFPCKRILLVADKGVIEAEKANDRLRAWYYSHAGDTETYWITREDIEMLWKKASPPKEDLEAMRALYHKDIVICNQQLILRYEVASDPLDSSTLDWDYKPDGTGIPYTWVWKSLEDPHRSRYFTRVEKPIKFGPSGFRERKGIVVHLDRIRDNYRELKAAASSKTTIMAVLKGDAYGLGLKEVACAVNEVEPGSCFGLSNASEAFTILEANLPSKPRLVIMEGVDPYDMGFLVKNNIEIFVWSLPIVEALNNEAVDQRKLACVHIKVDTGMGRLGIPERELPEFLNTLKGKPNLRVVGLASHLSDPTDQGHTLRQQECFERCRKLVEERLGSQLECHLASSAAFLATGGTNCRLDYDLVRIGGALYNAALPPRSVADHSRWKSVRLKNCVDVFGTVVHVRRDVRPGDRVGYGSTVYELPKTGNTGRGSIAIVNVGYADGVPFGYRGDVLVNNIGCPVVGEICLGMTFIDITHLNGVATLQPAFFVGGEGNSELSVSVIAGRSGSHPYKILSDFGRALEKQYRTRPLQDE